MDLQNYIETYNDNTYGSVEKTMMKVLVTGASGFIGSRVVSRLLSVYFSPRTTNFDLIYGALIGFLSGRMTEIGVFVKANKITQ